MPQTIWEWRRDTHLPPQFTTPYTDTWAYIGGPQDAQGKPPPPIQKGQVHSRNVTWVYSPVRNRVEQGWTLLNAGYGPIDYAVQPEWNKATIVISPNGRDDISYYRIRIAKKATPAVFVVDVTVPPTQLRYVSGTVLLPETDYQSNVQAEYYLGPEDTPPGQPDTDFSPDNIKDWKTPKNPVPDPPLNLRSPNRSNSWIDLAWNASANGTAVKYLVYSKIGTASPVLRATVTGLSTRVSGLLEDTKYAWYVCGQNASNQIGRESNILRWATGHEAIIRTGSVVNEPLHPSNWGGWRRDIGWLDWHYYPGRKINHQWVYQGYWPGPNNYGPTTANTSQYEQNGRYKGIVTYDAAGFRHRLNARYGYDIGSGFSTNNVAVTSVCIRRVYRQREPGNAAYQWLQWWLAYATPHNGEPVLRSAHRNAGANDADHTAGHDTMKAGMYHDYLRLPRYFGHAILQGWIWNTGTPVNAVGLYRGDNEHNGYGTAGYARFSGHGQYDTYRGFTQYASDWTILINCQWSIQTRAYTAPYQWT